MSGVLRFFLYFRNCLILALVLVRPVPADAREVMKFIIETRILSGDFQAGVKSIHTIVVEISEFSGKIIFTSRYKTGETEVFGQKLEATRSNFYISNPVFDIESEYMSFRATGETASGVLVLPNINYSLNIIFEKNKFTVAGCHDGYPAYKVTFYDLLNGVGKVLYYFKHESGKVLNLFGDCDVSVHRTGWLPH